MQVGSDPSFAPTVRSCAVEVLLSCCEAAPAAMRRVNGFAKAFFLMCMELAASGEEDQREWEQTLVRRRGPGSRAEQRMLCAHLSHFKPSALYSTSTPR